MLTKVVDFFVKFNHHPTFHTSMCGFSQIDSVDHLSMETKKVSGQMEVRNNAFDHTRK